MKNIVVGIADTETSRIAGRQAFALAELTGATVHVVTALDEAETAVIELGSDRFEINDIELAQQSTESLVKSLSPSVEWRVLPVEGKPAKALLEVAEQVGADLIVVGNVRMQGLGRVLGSVGNEVVHNAPCSVLIVKTV